MDKAHHTLTLDEVLSRMPEKRRPTLRRLLTSRFDQIMQGLESRRWSTIDEARAELRVSKLSMLAIRSALRIAGVVSWECGTYGFTTAAKARPAVQQRMFTILKDGRITYPTHETEN